MWDQLRNAMKHESTNPFPGFDEGPIDFPPTFKYDVRFWKWAELTWAGVEICQSYEQGDSPKSPTTTVRCESSSCPF
jgi:hypothetical protein